MITGFNTDVDHDSKVYHVQTEDKGLENPYIESLVYMGGAIIFSKRIEYKEKLVKGITEKEIRLLMENQHRTLIAAIKRGRLASLKKTTATLPEKEADAAPRSAQTQEIHAGILEGDIQDDKSLDEVILNYLSTAQEKDQLEITIPENMDFFSGQKVDHVVKVTTSISQQPVAKAPVEVRIMTTFLPKPLDAFSGLTGDDGKIRLTFAIPAFSQGAAAVVILARSREYGNAEFKKLVMKQA